MSIWFFYDIKNIDSRDHKRGTGVDNKLILSNVDKVSTRMRTWFRYPIVPGYNDSGPQIKRVAEFASKIPIEKVSLLPYHGLGETKYERLGRESTY
jgi:pyruvate formate lyase activating enzyme